MDLLAEYLGIMQPPSEKTTRQRGKFKVLVDYPQLFNEIEILRKEYDKGRYVKIGTIDKYITKEEYLSDIDRMWKDLTDLKDHPELLNNLIAASPKRISDGMFCKGRVTLYKEYKNTAVHYEDYYGWKYYSIRMKTISDTEAVVYINREIEHY